MSAAAETIDGGFAAPVFDAQSVFRAVMDAMARPGSIMPVRTLAAPPAPLSATAAAVALTLCDHDTPLWLDPALAGSSAVRTWLAFHAGAPLVDGPGDAAFVLVADAVGLGSLNDFAQGSQEYPDRSTTVILQVESLSSDAGAAPHPHPASGEREAPALRPSSFSALAGRRSRQGDEGQRRREPGLLLLDGPGIQTTATLAVSALPETFLAEWQDNRARFPRGVDIILAAPAAVACLPRTVKIREA
jgi:alpha-D-ribose 1-methylphosphonate 5-triphosphate synthase subunit PhnH